MANSAVPSYLEIETEDIFILMEGVLLSPIPLFSRIASYYGLISSKPLPPRTDFTILAYAGLRGALGLILAMELYQTVTLLSLLFLYFESIKDWYISVHILLF
uniref:NADH-plastoquinone oxidoreductase subunit 2 n=1 Tax=Heterorhabditis bacteriophora TaxID=37862 RepID=A0A1I7X642_HETBA